MSTDESIADLESRCREFVAATLEQLSWEWDGRFLLMLSVLEARHREDVEPLLARCFPHRFAHDTANLPAPVRDVLGGIGGLRPRQYILSTDPEADPVLFCAWWPWGTGGKISLRFGCWSAKIHGPARTELRESFRRWFA
jgi:hypothetical protein